MKTSLKKPGWNKWRARKEKHLEDVRNNFGDYREYIQAEFLNRKALAHKYSLRDFAKDLEISPSQLSRVLKGERGISQKSAGVIARKIGLSSHMLSVRFKRLAQALSSRAEHRKKLGKVALTQKLTANAKESEVAYKQVKNWKTQTRYLNDIAIRIDRPSRDEFNDRVREMEWVKSRLKALGHQEL